MKRILSIIMSLCLGISLLSSMTLSVNAVNIDVWDGSNDTSWYDANDQQNHYVLSTAEQLAGLAELVNQGNGFKGVTISLSTNINLDNIEWIPIGKGYINWDSGEVSLGFEGTFNGNGNTISGLSITVNSATSNNGYDLGGAALFGYLIEGIVKNIAVEGIVDVQEGVGMGNNAGIVGFNAGGTVENCINHANVKAQYTGAGIVGYNNGGIITKCSNFGTIEVTKGAGVSAGGITGDSEAGTISLCHNAGTVTHIGTKGAAYIGGIAGTGGFSNTIQNCYNTAAISTNWQSSECGGIVGSVYDKSNTISCYNVGVVSNSGDSKECGAISGNASDSNFLNNYYLDSSCNQGVGSTFTGDVTSKTSTELSDLNILTNLNKNGNAWGFSKDSQYPVFLFTIPADYANVDAAIANIPDDLSIYTSASVNALQNAISAVNRNKMADEQNVVDGYALAIENAIAALAIDKTDLNDTINQANELLNNAVIGNQLGQYPQSEVDKLKDSIEKAKIVLNDPEVSFDTIKQAKLDLLKDIEAFESSKITHVVDPVKPTPSNPDTGDRTNILMYMGIAILSLSLILLIQLNKKHKYPQ